MPSTKPKKTALVIDDEELICEVYRDGLTAYGLDVTYSCSLAEGEKILMQKNFDILILDYRMPGGTGLDLLRRLSKSGWKKPFIFLSTGYDDFDHKDAEGLGVTKIFHKPFELSEVIKSVLECAK